MSKCNDKIGGGIGTLQIGDIFFDWQNVTITKGKGAGRKSMSFTIESIDTDPVPSVPNLVSFVSGKGKKLFGGLLETLQVKYQTDRRVFGLTAVDFSRFLKVAIIGNYSQKLTFENHLQSLFLLSGATNSVEFPMAQNLLDLTIIGTPDINEDDPLGGVFQFDFEGYLQDALDQLCPSHNFYYDVDFGDWLNISLIGEGGGFAGIAHLFVVKNGEIKRKAPFDILIGDNVSEALICAKENDTYSNLSLNYTAPQLSEVIVAGQNARLTELNGDPLQGFSRPDELKYDIPADSQQRYYNLLSTKGTVLSVFIDSA